MDIIKSLMAILCSETIFFCVTASCVSYDFHCAATLLFLNFLFIAIFYKLDGSSIAKAALLSIGNLLGVSLNLLFRSIMIAIHNFSDIPFSAIISMVYPILSFIWIVPFWSFSLALLAQTKTKRLVLE